MSSLEIASEYKRWCEKAVLDDDVIKELEGISENEEKIQDAFYRNLAFGTGGLRGVIGAGTNRMNVYTVAKASQGLADYIIKNFPKEKWSIAISYDSRIKSNYFAEISAGVFSANGIKTYIYKQLMPTPCLSYAVRYLKCVAGVMVTASHNPSKYNGYKVYGEDGCQITSKVAKVILAEIDKLDIFEDVKIGDFAEALDTGSIEYISDDVETSFVEEVKKQSVLSDEVAKTLDKEVEIIYSPLNGTGLKPVLRTLKESGYSNITVVKEQELPDGNFPTCPYPNPEIKEAMELGIKYANKQNADLLLATDPDCDRVGIAVKDEKGLFGNVGEFVLLSGNETGILLLDYICALRTANGTMPEDPVMMKTIVSMDLGERVAAHYGVRTVNVLTGFKYIGEQIGILENEGKENSFIFGYEESYGYLSGSYIRDKDAVNAAYLICEMFTYYKSKGIGLLDRLHAIHNEYGYCLNTLHSYEFEGAAGFEQMQNIMQIFREEVKIIGNKAVKECLDYSKGLNGLPKSNVLKFLLEDNCSVVVRPSGTEPKLKVYVSVSEKNENCAYALEEKIMETMKSKIDE